MATKGLDINTETFSCSICLDLLKDPVTIPCGHSYCMSCVDSHWDEEESKKRYSCPQCRHSFTQRPVLVKNTMLAVLMEGLKMSGPPAAVVCPSAAHGDVFCDLCSGRKVRAVKSCLQCLVSYCKEHLQPHYDVAALKKHKLVEPTENLQENICSEHDEVMKMFCRTDQQCICYLCSVDQHKDHDTVTAAAERAEKQRELQTYQQNILHRLDHKHKEVDLLQQQVKNSSRSSNAALELSDRSLKELVAVLKKRISEVKQQVISQQEAEEHRIKELQDKVELEITELKKTLTALDTLSRTEDHVHFLHKFATVSKVSETSNSVNSSQSPPPFQDMVTAAVSKLRSALQQTSLMEPPAALHKPKVISSKPDSSSALAQGTAQSQQTSQKDGPLCQSLQPLHIQVDAPPPPPPPPPSSETSSLDYTAVVEQLKIDREIQYNTPPPNVSKEAWMQERGWRHFLTERPWSYEGLPSAPIPLEDTEEFPALPLHNLKLKTTASPCPPPAQSNYSKMKKHACKIIWDLRSLNDKLAPTYQYVSLSHSKHSQNQPHHPLRFSQVPQVLGKDSLKGQHYFELIWSSPHGTSVTIAVTYRDIRRDGSSDQCRFGMNAKSWALECFDDHSVFWHNRNGVQIPKGSSLIGVFVDYEAGVVSFYGHDRELYLIHTLKTRFTQPLVAGVRLDSVGSTVKFCWRMFDTHT